MLSSPHAFLYIKRILLRLEGMMADAISTAAVPLEVEILTTGQMSNTRPFRHSSVTPLAASSSCTRDR